MAKGQTIAGMSALSQRTATRPSGVNPFEARYTVPNERVTETVDTMAMLRACPIQTFRVLIV
ncbi:hypothetical protein [Hyphomonas sp.]|jgi:hypothetical protein|uniref:hypothetical protein n=1 Tax=Hyphomonas sp. TaxID=87 RepID=UPI0039E2D29A